MRNLFLPHKYYEVLRYKPNQLDFFESLFSKHIPLDTGEYFHDIFLTSQLWRRKFEHIVINKSPKELSEIAIKLCLPYFDFKIPDTKESMSSKFLFEKYIYGESGQAILLQDLSNLLLLSYHYYASPQIDEINHKSKQALFDKICFIQEERYNNLGNFKRNNSLFMNIFIYSKNKNKFSIDNQKIYDLDFIRSMISCNAKGSNPFAINKNHLEKFKDIDLSKMLDKYHEMFRVPTPSNSCDITNNKILKHTTLYNQYILERLSCVNFLNHYIHLTNNREPSHIYFETLQEYAICPLLNFRSFILGAIDIFYKQNSFYKTTTEFDLPLDYHLKRFLKQITTCALPILDITFRYLTNLQYHIYLSGSKSKVKSNNAFREYITTTFDKSLCDISAANSLFFFKISNEKLVATKCGFTSKNKNKYPASFYINLFDKIASQCPKNTTIKTALSSTRRKYIDLIRDYKEDPPLGIITSK